MKYLLVLLLLSHALPSSAAVIFMYHRFGESEFPSTNARLEQFEAQLDFLERDDFEVWPLPKLVSYWQEGRATPDKVVVITIDDAYESVYREAFPRLKSRGMPFTVFVATDPVDQGIARYMNWDQLRELHRAGVTLANHSATHDYLLRRRPVESEQQWLARIRSDIEKGQRRLQEELGETANEAPRLFAWPFGEYDGALAGLVQEMGYVAFGQQSGAADSHTDRRALPRFPVNERYGELPDFALKARSLAFPVTRAEPWSPRVRDGRAPALILEFAESDADLGRLTCYFGSEAMNVEKTGKSDREFRVSVKAELPVGRSRYNCTAPHARENRWYWYSHLWIRGRD